MVENEQFDAAVVGAGPNGLAAAITLQQAGLSVVLLEAKNSVGGGMRSAELTLPGFTHDICSAIHPMGVVSPFFASLPLDEFGLEWIYPPIAMAHPFDDRRVAFIDQSIQRSANSLGVDSISYQKIMYKLVKDCDKLIPDILAPLGIPASPLAFANFGVKAMQSASGFANRKFSGREAKGLFAGLAAHSILPLENIFSNAIGLVLGMIGHKIGWPFPKGGSQQIANALEAYFISIGGKVVLNHLVNTTDDLPSAKAILFDLTPHQLICILGNRLPPMYKSRLKKYKYGPGVFKIDYALDDHIPFAAPECLQTATLHLGGTLEEIAYSEKAAWQGKHVEKPFVLLAQQSLFDNTRAPEGKHTAWAYCHVPNGSTVDMTVQIENQIERFAPGFRERILSKHLMTTELFQEYNPNYIGGDINGGASDLTQLFTRPVAQFSPYSIPIRGMYICSASSPPGGGVHGMCGYHAAKAALKDIFKIIV